MTASQTTPAQAQILARWTGILFLVTFATSIPPVVAFYVQALSNPNYVVGAGNDLNVSWGAFLELLLIVSNIGTAVLLFPVLKRRNEVFALGYVTARLVECGFIALGLISLLALQTLRSNPGTADAATLVAVGKSLVAIHDWTFRLGPGFIVGIGNGLLLGYLMYATRLVPRPLTWLGLVGGPLIILSGIAGLIRLIETGSIWQGIATAPEFFWELSLGIWLTVKGFNPSAVLDLTTPTRAGAS